MSSHPQLNILAGTHAPRKPQPLRVLTLTPFYPSETNDTNGCFVSEPLHALSRAGIENRVLAVRPMYRGKVRSSGANPAEFVRYFSLPSGFGLPTAGVFVFSRIVGKIRELQKAQQIDLIHAHAPLPCGHAAMLLNAELGIPYVVSVHGLDAFSTEQVGGRAGDWCRRISQRVYRSSQRVICVSERVREQVLQGTGSNCRTSVVYNGVDPALFSPDAEASPEQTVLSVGNLIPVKGHETLIRAIASLVSEFPALKLDIIGEGSELSRLKAVAGELQIRDRVRFFGRQSRAQVAAAMRRCLIFALPSRYEGLGCVYLEAMSVGKPTIGCREQGISEIIQHGVNGFLVGKDNERELALAIGMLLRDQALRQKLSNAARDTVLDRLTLPQQAERLERIYRECVR